MCSQDSETIKILLFSFTMTTPIKTKMEEQMIMAKFSPCAALGDTSKVGKELTKPVWKNKQTNKQKTTIPT